MENGVSSGVTGVLLHVCASSQSSYVANVGIDWAR